MKYCRLILPLSSSLRRQPRRDVRGCQHLAAQYTKMETIKLQFRGHVIRGPVPLAQLSRPKYPQYPLSIKVYGWASWVFKTLATTASLSACTLSTSLTVLA